MFFVIKNERYDGVVYAETLYQLLWQVDSAFGCPFSCYYYPSQYKNFSITWDANNNMIGSEGGDVMEEYDFINIDINNIPQDTDTTKEEWFKEYDFYYGADFLSYDVEDFCEDFFQPQNLNSYKKYNALDLRKKIENSKVIK